MLLEAYIACTGNGGTVQLTTNFKKIWFCMHGIMLGASSPFSLYFICFQIIVINYAKTMDLFVLCKLKTFNFVVNILMWINIVKITMKKTKNMTIYGQKWGRRWVH
jgi:hypothetical protein